ncbi:hypothetical protein A2U01_0023531, partial [Trifolium medium]|nr:hypothetical protein [Trifolium medium]
HKKTLASRGFQIWYSSVPDPLHSDDEPSCYTVFHLISYNVEKLWCIAFK